jgi:tetratricopeptide (TPR) repeat protein
LFIDAANADRAAGRLDLALSEAQRAHDLITPIRQDALGGRTWARSAHTLAAIHLQAGRKDQAHKWYREAIAEADKVQRRFPKDLDARHLLAKMQGEAGTFAHQREYESIVATLEQSRDALTRLADENPQVGAYRADLAMTSFNLAVVRSRQGKLPETMESCARAIQLLEQLVQQDVASLKDRLQLVRARVLQAECLIASNRPEDAKPILETARKTLIGMQQANIKDLDITDTVEVVNKRLAQISD